MNKNEYYRFDSNLNAKIAIDEEKAKKGDADAMVRLANYFRTGATISFDYQSGNDRVARWFVCEDGEGKTCQYEDVFEGYLADKMTFDKGLE